MLLVVRGVELAELALVLGICTPDQKRNLVSAVEPYKGLNENICSRVKAMCFGVAAWR